MSSIRKFLPKINFNSIKMTTEQPTEPSKETLLDIYPNFNEITFPADANVYVFDYEKYALIFKEIETLGSSKYTVKSVKHLPSGRTMAIKYMHIPHTRYGSTDDNQRRIVELGREINTIRTLKDVPNVIDCYGICLYENQALICMEQMDFSLKEVYIKVKNAGERFPEEFLACVAIAMLHALIDCKAKNMIHRDVKPENILLNRSGEIKLSDFGEARILENSLASTFTGTLTYWPPERFIVPQPPLEAPEPMEVEDTSITSNSSTSSKPKYDVRADIWSYGLVLLEVINGTVPYKDSKGNVPNNIILLQNLILNLKGDHVIDALPKEVYSEELREFLKLCLKKLEDRPKYDGLKATKFYQKYGTLSLKERNAIVAKWIKHYGL